MTQRQGPRDTGERPTASRRSGFAPGPRVAVPAAPSYPDSSKIPDKLYFRIGEVARLCDVQAYVLRFWETEFPQLRPNKGGTGQRLFRRRDVEMAMRIRHLLYDEGYTIPGARQLLKSEARPREAQLALVADPAREQERSARFRALERGLRDLHAILSRPPAAAGAAEDPSSNEIPARSRRPGASPRRAEVVAVTPPATLFDPPPPEDTGTRAEAVNEE